MNLPNKLTLFRIILVPILVFIWLFPFDSFGISLYTFMITINGNTLSISLLNIIVLIIFGVASITDYFDGHIARKNNLITTFGKFADPIADKLLVNTVFILLSAKGMIPVLPVVIMLGRDIIVDGCRMLAANNNIVVAAGFLGKLKTVLQMISIVVILLNNIPFEFINLPLDSILLWFTALVSAISGYSYFYQLKDLIFESV